MPKMLKVKKKTIVTRAWCVCVTEFEEIPAYGEGGFSQNAYCTGKTRSSNQVQIYRHDENRWGMYSTSDGADFVC